MKIRILIGAVAVAALAGCAGEAMRSANTVRLQAAVPLTQPLQRDRAVSHPLNDKA